MIKSLFRDDSDIRKNKQTRRNYVLGVANGVTIPKKRWKKQVLTLIITTNHAILVALVECLSRDWFVYVPRRVLTSVWYFCSQEILHREIATQIFIRKVRKNPVKSKYKLSSFDSRSASVRRVSYHIVSIEEFLDSNRESNAWQATEENYRHSLYSFTGDEVTKRCI